MEDEEEKGGRLFFSMGEVAEMLDVNQSLIRFWEQKFAVIKPRKNKKGNRMFTPADVRNLKMIYHLVKERGMTLAGAEKYMKASRKDIERDMELAERLQSIRSLLLEVRQQLGSDGPVLEDTSYDNSISVYDFAQVVVTDPKETEPGNRQIPDTETNDTIMDGVPLPETESSSPDTLPCQTPFIQGMTSEPENTPDLEPTSTREQRISQKEQSKPEAPNRPLYIEQTLF